MTRQFDLEQAALSAVLWSDHGPDHLPVDHFADGYHRQVVEAFNKVVAGNIFAPTSDRGDRAVAVHLELVAADVHSGPRDFFKLVFPTAARPMSMVDVFLAELAERAEVRQARRRLVNAVERLDGGYTPDEVFKGLGAA